MVKGKSAAPDGAVVVKEESVDEFQEKLAQPTKQNSIETFLKTKQEEERKQVKAMSGDMEVIKDVDKKELKALQEAKRLYGWDPKTRTALVLKLAFIEKVKKS